MNAEVHDLGYKWDICMNLFQADTALSLLEQAVNRLLTGWARGRLFVPDTVAMKTASEKRDGTPTIPAGTGG